MYGIVLKKNQLGKTDLNVILVLVSQLLNNINPFRLDVRYLQITVLLWVICLSIVDPISKLRANGTKLYKI